MKSVIRLGSRTPIHEILGHNPGRYVEVNSIDSINVSRDKLRMKNAFRELNIPQSEWYLYNGGNIFTEQGEHTPVFSEEMPYPIIAKKILGYKGIGMEKLESHEEMMEFLSKANIREYYFEKFYNFGKEYRIHCTPEYSFLAWRKLRQADAEAKWFFNNSNCAWISEDNPSFDAPANMNAIKESCVSAIKATGLDIGAVDVRVQNQNKNNPDYIILEVNSAPRMGDTSTKLYQKELTKIINKKINEYL